MNEPRVIKKYPNRRLYDTKESRYITLHDVRQLVLDDEVFEVIDKKTGENITRSILLQVISEQELRGESVMSEDFLAHIIRSYSDSMPKAVAGYLEQSLTLFLEQQRKIGESLRGVVGKDPLSTMAELAQQNLEQWLELQKQMLKAVQPGGTKAASGPDLGAASRASGRK